MRSNSVLFILLVVLFFFSKAVAQQPHKDGVIVGAVIDTSSQKAIMGATVAVIPYKDSTRQSVFLTDKNGGFSFSNLELGYYRLQISAVGFRTLTIDSIHLRTDQ